MCTIQRNIPALYYLHLSRTEICLRLKIFQTKLHLMSLFMYYLSFLLSSNFTGSDIIIGSLNYPGAKHNFCDCGKNLQDTNSPSHIHTHRDAKSHEL